MRSSDFEGKCGHCEEEVEISYTPEYCPQCGTEWQEWEPDFSDVDFPVKIRMEYIWENWELHSRWQSKTGHEEMPGDERGKYAEATVTYLIHEDGSITTDGDSR